jgi:hypothetical protein
MQAASSWHFSAAELNNVIEITPCLDRTHARLPNAKPKTTRINYPRIKGLLLRYADGKRECLDSYRLGRTPASLETSKDSVLCLCFERDGFGNVYLDKVELGRSPYRNDDCWMRLPLQGKVEWWSSYTQTMVCNQTKASSDVDSGGGSVADQEQF